MRKTRTALALLAGAVSACPILLSSTAHATITFNLIGLSTLTPNAQVGFQTAANRWASALDVVQNGTSVNVTLNISVGFTSLPSGVIAETSPSTGNYWYSQFRNALGVTSNDGNDATAIANLPGTNLAGTAATVPLYINHTKENGNSATPYVYSTPNTVTINRATAKALGLDSPTDTAIDASITFSSAFTYDFDPTNGTDSGAIDFAGVVTHEFGHALGFASNVDELDTPINQGMPQSLFTPTPLDMFRYSSASSSLGAIDFTLDTREKYFSLDKGVTKLGDFSNGQTAGDYQASHWKHAVPALGIMDPATNFGQTVSISSLDREAMDVIGWARVNSWKWTDTTSSSTAYWGNAARWNADGVPDSTITALFANGSSTPYTVAINAPSTAAAITVCNDAVTFNLTNSTLTSGTVNLGQNSGNVATLNIQKVSAGQFNTGNLTVGAAANTTGHLNIQNGGIVAATGSLIVAPVATSVGTVTIGAGTMTITGDANIGGTSSAFGGMGALSVNAGGSLQVAGKLRVWGVQGTIASVAGGNLNVAGSSTVHTGATFIESAGTYSTSGLTLNGTFTQSGGNATAGAITGTGSANISGGTLNANSISIAALTASGTGKIFINPNGGNSGTSRVSSLSISGNGQVDLNDNDLILDYSGNSPIAALRGTIDSGFNSGYWNGPGLTTMAGRNNASFTTAIGYAEASSLGVSTFDGQAVDSTTLLVKYTYYGDTNLDGKVDATDFADFLDGYANGGSTWFEGDFTYDGAVDLGNDFNLLLNAYLHQGGALGSLQSVVEAAPLSDVQRATFLAIVPEPSMAAFGIVIGCAMLPRRRR